MKKSRLPAAAKSAGGKLEPIEMRVAGIDIGSRQMYVCGPVAEDGQREIRVFTTTTEQIQLCARWLKQLKVKSVAMESTGVYWIPILEILESSGLETLLVDARQLARVPGRKKTDPEDCQWIQTLHSHGLLSAAYRPAQAISELRTIVRQKAVLVREQSDWVRRMHKCLDQMNVRLHHAVSDTQGVTGMSILRAIVAGQRDPHVLAQLRDPGCRRSAVEIAEFLAGHWREDHLFNLQEALQIYDSLGERICAYEREIQRRMESSTPAARKGAQAPSVVRGGKRKGLKRRHQEGKREALFRMVGADLTAIDGVGVETAEVIISEYGVDLSKFATEKEFVSHVKLIPLRPVSGGKVLKKRAHQKGTRTAAVLRNAATALRNSRSALGAYYRRLARRKDASIAVFATARKLATLIYRMLRWGQPYVDMGQENYEQRYRTVKLRTLATTAAQMGYKLVLQEAATP